MRKLSQVVMHIVENQPFLEEAIAHGFLNLTAFAEYIQPYVEKELQKTVSIHALKMAISRLPVPEDTEYLRVKTSFSKITTQWWLSIMTVVRSPHALELVTTLMAETRHQKTQFFTLVEWVSEIDIIYSTKDRTILDDHISQTLQILSVSWLWLISCLLSDREISTPWFFYRTTKKLAFHGINIIQILSTYHELGIIVAETDMKEVVSLLMD